MKPPTGPSGGSGASQPAPLKYDIVINIDGAEEVESLKGNLEKIAALAEQLGINPDERGAFQKKVLDFTEFSGELGEAWSTYYRPGMGRKESRAFKAGFAAGRKVG